MNHKQRAVILRVNVFRSIRPDVSLVFTEEARNVSGDELMGLIDKHEVVDARIPCLDCFSQLRKNNL